MDLNPWQKSDTSSQRWFGSIRSIDPTLAPGDGELESYARCHFTDKETEAQRDTELWPTAPMLGHSWDFKPSPLAPRATILKAPARRVLPFP